MFEWNWFFLRVKTLISSEYTDIFCLKKYKFYILNNIVIVNGNS